MAAGAIIAKVAGAVLSNEKERELVLVLITAILMPIILLILVWIPLLSGTADVMLRLWTAALTVQLSLRNLRKNSAKP